MFQKFLNGIVMSSLIKEGEKGLALLDENSKTAGETNKELLLRIIKDNKDTEYGKKYNFDQIHSLEDFKRSVPFSEYDDYAPYIERMINNNETNLISSYPAVFYAKSSGSVGAPKYIPVSQETIDVYSLSATSRLFASVERYHRKKFGKGFPRGRGLNTMEVQNKPTKSGVPSGTISGSTVANKKKFLKYAFTSPLPVIFPEEQMDMKYLKLRYALEDSGLVFMVSAFMTGLVDIMNYMKHNWEMLCDDIEKGTINDTIMISDKLRSELTAQLKPNHKRADFLRKEFSKGFETPIVPRIWPNMTWIGAIGTGGFTGYTEKMREFTGKDIYIDFTVYAASESLFAGAVQPEDTSFVVYPHACFYEFIPEDAEDDSVTYSLDELEVGKNYEVVLTNLSGFYRYKIKDVVKVTGYYNKAPKIEFVYRKNQMISIAGEKTSEESLRWVINEFQKETGIFILDYAIYADTESDPGRYIILLEPDHELPMSKRQEYRDILEEKMSFANPSYGDKIKTGVLSPMVLHYSQIETHAAYRDFMIMKGTSANQLKPVRVLDTPRKEKFFLTMIEEETD